MGVQETESSGSNWGRGGGSSTKCKLTASNVTQGYVMENNLARAKHGQGTHGIRLLFRVQ